jgi:hypothetical protein
MANSLAILLVFLIYVSEVEALLIVTGFEGTNSKRSQKSVVSSNSSQKGMVSSNTIPK